jgi:hypothetical protein
MSISFNPPDVIGKATKRDCHQRKCSGRLELPWLAMYHFGRSINLEKRVGKQQGKDNKSHVVAIKKDLTQSKHDQALFYEQRFRAT